MSGARFRVLINDVEQCMAGIDGHGVLSANVTWIQRSVEDLRARRRLDPHEDEEEWLAPVLELTVGGMDANKFLTWIGHRALQIGDEVEVRWLQKGEFDEPTERYDRSEFIKEAHTEQASHKCSSDFTSEIENGTNQIPEHPELEHVASPRYRLRVNQQHVCTCGLDTTGVLGVNMYWVDRPDRVPKAMLEDPNENPRELLAPRCALDVGANVGDRGDHISLRWIRDHRLGIGDVLQIKILTPEESFDEPRERTVLTPPPPSAAGGSA